MADLVGVHEEEREEAVGWNNSRLGSKRPRRPSMQRIAGAAKWEGKILKIFGKHVKFLKIKKVYCLHVQMLKE